MTTGRPDELSPHWAAGDLVGGRYRLRSILGHGAMGVVWRAEHLALGVDVAIKLVDLGTPDGVGLERFRREAQTAAQITSKNVVRILDHGAHGRVGFMTMELLEGESLEQLLARRERLSASETLQIIRDVAAALEKAHALGVVHRDIKPSNVFLANEEGAVVVKVLDFGLAKLLGAERDAALDTQAGQLVGTPAYMSPEQALGHPVDHRSDLWQLAVLAFECLTGDRPFEGATLGDTYLRICAEPMPVPSRVAPVPSGFDAWFSRAARRSARERFASCKDLVSSLAIALHDASSAPAGNNLPESHWSAPAFDAQVERSSYDNLSRESASSRRRGRFAMAIVPTLLVTLGALLLWADFGAPQPAIASPLDSSTALREASFAVLASAKPLLEPTAPLASSTPEAKPHSTSNETPRRPARGATSRRDDDLGF